MSKDKISPLMRQYFDVRGQYADALLFFQVGDFYELFFDDAKKASAFLGITLTKRGKHQGQDIPLCGIPCHAIGHHLTKLVKGGFKVAICDQVEKSRPGAIVARKVTKLLTPGTLTDSVMLDEKSPSYLCSFFPGKEDWGLVFVELLTFQTFATTIPEGQMRILESEVVRFLPDEVVLESQNQDQGFTKFFSSKGYPVSFSKNDFKNKHKTGLQMSLDVEPEPVDAWQGELLNQWFDQQFEQEVRAKLTSQPALTRSIGNMARYLSGHNRSALDQINTINFYDPQDFLVIDPSTQQNLEIVAGSTQGTRKNTLLSVLDKAKTSMGSRTIKKWLLKPLIERERITQRLDTVQAISGNVTLLLRLSDLMVQISDLERIIGRIVLDRALAADFILLKESLKKVPEIKALLASVQAGILSARICDQLHDLPEIITLLDAAINEELGGDASPIKDGFDAELDRLRGLVTGAQKKILELEAREVEKTGINSLKVRYNDVYGYSIEVTKTNIKLVPEHYVLQQTLVARNRYLTPELQKLAGDINDAREHIDEAETKVFDAVKNKVMAQIGQLRRTTQALSSLDAILGFATAAYENGYCKPELTDSRDIVILEGRHAVVERAQNIPFIPNNTQLTDDQSLWIITGPNMGGKSTYLRQVALISIMAQAGSMVPATRASLPILDRIFTRIGSGDNLAAGKSTFLVEMEEAALICRQATDKSLVILDEVGRGTSTFDGMAIAQAIIEYIYKTVKSRCLFATHYHELTHMRAQHTGIANYMMRSQKTKSGIVFLHEIAPGSAGGSFGIEVAKLADLPNEVVSRARDLVDHLGNQHGPSESLTSSNDKFTPATCSETCSQSKLEAQRLKIIIGQLTKTHPDNLTPRQAHDLISRVWTGKEAA